MTLRTALAPMVLLLASTLARAAEEAKIQPELKPDEALLAKIAALPDNTWLKLPPIKTAGDLDWLSKTDEKRRWGPFVRDYSNWMVWAPERKRALYCGGGHNIDPMNDVWEYDLASNTWACLLGADSITPKMKRGQSLADFVKENATFQDGVVLTKSGGPLRPCHTWCALCYDPVRKRMLWYEPHQGLVFTDKAAVAQGLGLTADQFTAQRAPRGYIWSFDPETRKWAGVQTDVPGGEAAVMVYVPDLKTLWMKCGTRDGRTCVYDAEKKVWKDLSNKGMPGYGAVGAYDPEAKTVVAVDVKKTYTYSFEKNEWKVVQTDAPAWGRDASCILHWDPVAKKFILYSMAVNPHLWLYDLGKNEWTDPKPQGDVPGGGRVGGYYDPERNVTVYYNSRDVWVYRCTKAAEDKPPKDKEQKP